MINPISLLLCVILINRITLILIRMKHLFKIPQKRGKNYICNSQEKIALELSEIKIKNVKQLSDNNGFYIDINLVPGKNKESIKTINEIDVDAKSYLNDNAEEDVNINDIYIIVIYRIYVNFIYYIFIFIFRFKPFIIIFI